MITIGGKDISAIVIDNKEVIRISDYITGDIMWEKVPMNYFYIHNTYSGQNTVTITSTMENSPTEGYFTRTLEYSKDCRLWTAVTLEHQVSTTITLNQGEKVYFRNTNGKFNFDNGFDSFYSSFSASQSHNVGGNIETLLDYKNIGRLSYNYSGMFANTLKDDTNLVSASNLTMPSNSLSVRCCYGMFKGCTSLTAAPDLPSTSLGKECYRNMFKDCTSLTAAPDLPATSVDGGVYYSMFRGCTSLTTTNALMLNILTQDCYREMYYGCTSLVTAPAIRATVYGTSSCQDMFRDCTSLNSMYVYANNVNARYSTLNWLNNVAPSGVFYNYGYVEWDFPSVSGIPQGWRIVREDYLYVDNLHEGTNYISLIAKANGTPTQGDYAESVEYSKNKRDWDTLYFDGTTSMQFIEMDEGDRVYFRNTSGKWNCYDYHISIYAHYNYKVGGNVNSLLDYTDIDNVSLPNCCFESLFGIEDFNTNTTLVDASELILPEKNLSFACCTWMFHNCTALTSAPSILPATTLAQSCYSAMFDNCTSLTTVPSLPATTLAKNCYANMFNGCTALTTAPTLPATNLAYGCYANMFNSCTSLTTAPSLPATTLAAKCYYNMFAGCTSLTTTPSLPATTLENASNCYSYMFNGCTALTTAPALPATTLANYCYQYMFQNCTSLTTAPELPATTLADNCYQYMFHNCTSLTTAPALPATTLVSDCYYSMFSGCSSLNSVFVYANNIPGTAIDCTGYWLKGVAATGYFYNFGSLTYTTDSASGIPSGWSNIKGDYLYIENTYSGTNTVSFTNISVSPTGNYSDRVEYSKDKQNWNTLIFTTGGTKTLTLNQGEKLYLRNNSGYFNWYNSDSDDYRTSITCSQTHKIGGNINSLLNFADEDNVRLSNCCFMTLFKNDTTLTDATSLNLPATRLAIGCYRGMFNGCTNLTTAPTLMARTLVVDCYRNMFYNCSSLNDVSVGADTNSASNCTNGWLYGVSATGTFHNLGFASYSSGASGIPSGWTVVYS